MDANPAFAQPAPKAPRHWGVFGTIAWSVVIAAIFVVLQLITTLVIMVRGKGRLTEQQILDLLEAMQTDGFALSISTFVTTLTCVPLTLGIAKLRRGSQLADYFALRPVPIRSLRPWLGALVALAVITDGLGLLLGKPIVPEFSRRMYESAEPVWLLWLALVVAAPLFEETFMRGFLFKGLASSFIGPIGAVVITAALWAAIHVQYDLYGIVTIFFLGLLLGMARWGTGSLYAPIVLHAAANAISTVETVFLR